MSLFHRPSIGLDISDRSIEAVFVVNKNGRGALQSYGRAVLPPGVVVDGIVAKRDELSLILRKLLADQMTPPLPRGMKRAVFALPESQVFSHVFEVPRNADENELLKTLSIEADRYFPYGHAELVPAYVAIDVGPETKRVYFAAAPRTAVSSYLDLFAVSNIEPAVIEGEATSIARAVCGDKGVDPFALVDVGARVTSLSIFDHHGIQFSESLATAGDSFTNALSVAGKIELDAAEDMKRSAGLTGEMPVTTHKALVAQVDALVADIRQAIAYYTERSGRPPLHMFLCGGSMLMPGLLEHLQGALADEPGPLVVTLANPFECMTVDAALEKAGVRERGVLIATAIGLALRGAGIQKFPDLDFLRNAHQLVPKKKGLPPVVTTPSTNKTVRAYQGLSHNQRVAASVILILAIVVGVWALAFKVVPLILHRQPSVAVSPPNVIAGDVTQTFTMSLAGGADMVQLASIDVSQSAKDNVAHEGGTSTEGKASGEIVITNDGNASQALVATTRFLSEGGILFRLNQKTIVAPHKTATATITADKSGATGDVGPGRFTIPGLPKAQQAKVYGTSSAAMTGGVVSQGGPLTQAELDAAKTALVNQTSIDLMETIRGKVPAGQVLLDALVGVTSAEITKGPTVGQSTGAYDLEVWITARGLTFDESVIKEALAMKAQTTTLGPIRYTIKEVDIGKGTATVEATASPNST